jgi:hypothetical protein
LTAFLIGDSFTDALARLEATDQKAVKTSAFDLQMNQSAPGLQLHRIDKSKDPNFWSVRVSRDIRIIVHKTAASFLLAYVDHHDRAYAWAERRRIEAHPKTGAVQIVEVRERVEVAAPDLFTPPPEPGSVAQPLPAEPLLFEALSTDDLLAIGVPMDWVATVRGATETRFFDLVAHLPAEASEALLEYAATGKLAKPEPAPPAADPFTHPDALRRFRVVENMEELQAALDAPWEKWAVFLHPSQRSIMERAYTGPARVAGSAGTGKTVVALHRATRLARLDANARVLLTTFSQPLADALQRKLAVLLGHDLARTRITVAPWTRLADELFQLVFSRRPRVATDDQVRAAMLEAAQATGETGFSDRFLFGEFTQVIDAWQVASIEAYAETPRPGRRNRLGARQREKLWPIFTAARARLQERGLTTWPHVFAALTAHHAHRTEKPFDHIVVDEAQDLGVAELRLLAVLARPGTDTLFFAGDLGQRIFQPPFSWKALGVDVRGRSATLKVNYRTSHQIREAADRLLPATVRDMDGREEVRRGTISVFDGPLPEILVAPDQGAEITRAGQFIQEALAAGIHAEEIGVFVRDRPQLDRARRAIQRAGLTPVEPGDAEMGAAEHVTVGTMHLAKGLEFKAVLVLACDDEVLPLAARVAAAVDESDLEEVYETERQLFYVACTRARDRLLVSGVQPASEFLADMR